MWMKISTFGEKRFVGARELAKKTWVVPKYLGSSKIAGCLHQMDSECETSLYRPTQHHVYGVGTKSVEINLK